MLVLQILLALILAVLLAELGLYVWELWFSWEKHPVVPLSTDGQPTTASPTKDNPSGAAPLVWEQMTLVDRVLLVAGMVKDAAMGSITPTTQPSLQSAPPVTESGPAGPGCECAPADYYIESWAAPPPTLRGLSVVAVRLLCRNCRASWLFGKIPVPAAAPQPSTSASPASTPSVQAPEAAPSPSSSSVAINCHAGHAFPAMSFTCYCGETERSWL